jgi:hypothetical protein
MQQPEYSSVAGWPSRHVRLDPLIRGVNQLCQCQWRKPCRFADFRKPPRLLESEGSRFTVHLSEMQELAAQCSSEGGALASFRAAGNLFLFL